MKFLFPTAILQLPSSLSGRNRRSVLSFIYAVNIYWAPPIGQSLIRSGGIMVSKIDMMCGFMALTFSLRIKTIKVNKHEINTKDTRD